MEDDHARRLDVLKREIIILSARLTKVINDSAHLVRALRNVTDCDTLLGNEEDGVLGAPSSPPEDPFGPWERSHD